MFRVGLLLGAQHTQPCSLRVEGFRNLRRYIGWQSRSGLLLGPRLEEAANFRGEMKSPEL